MDLNQHKNLHECHWLSGREAGSQKYRATLFHGLTGEQGSGVMIDSGTWNPKMLYLFHPGVVNPFFGESSNSLGWWFGARWFGYVGSPYQGSNCYFRGPLESNPKPTTRTTDLPSVDLIVGGKHSPSRSRMVSCKSVMVVVWGKVGREMKGKYLVSRLASLEDDGENVFEIEFWLDTQNVNSMFSPQKNAKWE